MLNPLSLDRVRRCSRLLLATLALAMLAACGSYSQGGRLDTLDRTAKAYGVALGRAEFERAAFVAGIAVEKAKLDQLRQVKVLAYEEQALQASPDVSEARQVARIEYTLTGSMRVRRIEDQQTWKYDEPSGRWLLSSGLPDFLGAK